MYRGSKDGISGRSYLESPHCSQDHHLLHASPAAAVAFYDPRLGAVVVASHSPAFKTGQVIDMTLPDPENTEKGRESSLSWLKDASNKNAANGSEANGKMTLSARSEEMENPIMNGREFAGRWQVVEALDDEYLGLSSDPHLLIEVKSGNDISGSYQFGAQEGDIDGHIERDSRGRPRIIFTFEGSDEMDPVSGYGTVSFETPEVLLLEMHHHLGDTYRYRCRRS